MYLFAFKYCLLSNIPDNFTSYFQNSGANFSLFLKKDSSKLGIHQTIQKNSVGFIPWDAITLGKDRIP
jgi:hypothetical protein